MSGIPFPDALRAAAEEQYRRSNDAIEAMCERMLTTPGDYGVLVTDFPGGTVRVELTHDVPFGEIHYRRAQNDESPA